MSGRAGRRGKDDKGIVIQMLDENMEPDIAKNMIYGASDPLFSSYHVGYNMVLNMLRVEDANPENLIRSSFHQFQQERDAPELERQAVELRKEASSVVIEHGDAVQEYDKLSKLLSVKKKEINSILMRPEYCLPFLHCGRLIHVNCDDIDWGWGVLVNVSKLNSSSSGKNHKAKVIDTNLIRSKDDEKELEYVADVLLEVWLSSNADGQILPSIKPKPSRNEAIDKGGRSELAVVHVAFDSIIAMSTIRLKMPKNLTSDTQKQEVLSSISEVCRRFEPPTGEGIPLLDIDADFSVPSNLVVNLLPVRDDLEIRISKNILHNLPSKERLLELYNLKMKLIKESDYCMHKAKDSQAVAMKEQLKKMKRVLRKLEFINAENVLAPKGRFSCELTTADELVLTNMVFDGVFNELTVPQTVALLSCFVHKEESKNNNNNNMRSDMQAPFRQLQSVARNVAKICFDVRLITDEDEYVSAFSPGLVDVTYAWCTGAKFADICKLTDAFEGNIIRVLRRLEELLRQLASASLAIGNAELKDMFEQGSMKIRRGVVFAASLYL
jgi:ATP-dependent RNA helicase DOB1